MKSAIFMFMHQMKSGEDKDDTSRFLASSTLHLAIKNQSWPKQVSRVVKEQVFHARKALKWRQGDIQNHH